MPVEKRRSIDLRPPCTTAPARYGAYTLLLIDYALFLVAGVLGSFAIACIV
jgi:hypothetical protein